MTTAFQANAFQSVTLAFQIDGTPPPPPNDMIGTDPVAGSPGIQWVSMEDADRFRALVKRRDEIRAEEWDERAEVRQLMDEVIAGPVARPTRDESVPLVTPPQAGIDMGTWRLMLEELRDIQRRRDAARRAAEDEDDVEMLLMTMH